MENKTTQSDPPEDKPFVNNPHDKYVRYSLQIRELAIAFFQFALDETLINLLAWETFQPADESFIDENLKGHYTDVCYKGMTASQKPIRIALLVEHKSVPPAKGEITEQLGRYIFNARQSDRTSGNALSLTVPIVLYHGKKRLRLETPAAIYPETVPALLEFVPAFNYYIVDLGAIPDEEVDSPVVPALRQFLLALKYSRNEKMILDFWADFLKFAAAIREHHPYIHFVSVTVRYLNNTSRSIQNKFQDMDNRTTTTLEEKLFKEYMDEWRQEGIEKGIKKGIEQGLEIAIQRLMLKKPDWTDQEVADALVISVALVKKIRNELKK